MTTGKSVCETCDKEFKWRRCNGYLKIPKYCSISCKKNENQSCEQILIKLENSFQKNVIKKDGCWEWKGAKDSDGYSRMSNGCRGGFQRAARASYIIHKGEIPESMIVCHRCDKKECTNPDCLFLGFPIDNSKDMVSKDRQAKGSRIGTSKLDENKVKEIKSYFMDRVPMRKIAEKFGVNISVIEKIKSGSLWNHVGDRL